MIDTFRVATHAWTNPNIRDIFLGKSARSSGTNFDVSPARLYSLAYVYISINHFFTFNIQRRREERQFSSRDDTCIFYSFDVLLRAD